MSHKIGITFFITSHFSSFLHPFFPCNMYWSWFSPPTTNLFQIFSTSLSRQLLGLYLFLNNKQTNKTPKIKTNKITKKKIWNKGKQSKTKQKLQGVNFVLTNYSWACDLPWSVVAMPSDTPWGKKKKNWLSIHQQVSIANSFLVRCETLYLHPPLSVETTSGLNLRRSYSCCHSLCRFICISVLFCMEDTISLESSISSGSYSLPT